MKPSLAVARLSTDRGDEERAEAAGAEQGERRAQPHRAGRSAATALRAGSRTSSDEHAEADGGEAERDEEQRVERQRRQRQQAERHQRAEQRADGVERAVHAERRSRGPPRGEESEIIASRGAVRSPLPERSSITIALIAPNAVPTAASASLQTADRP